MDVVASFAIFRSYQAFRFRMPAPLASGYLHNLNRPSARQEIRLVFCHSVTRTVNVGAAATSQPFGDGCEPHSANAIVNEVENGEHAVDAAI